MAVPTDELGWVNRLSRAHDTELPELRELNDEYELRSRRMYMHPELLRELGDRMQQVVHAWGELVVGSLEERLDVEGFRLRDQASDDADLWRVWQYNDADEGSQQAHVDALVMKRAYLAVGTNEDDADTPLLTFESPLEVYAEIDPRNRKVRAALRRWSEYDSDIARVTERYATLYLPDATVSFGAAGGSDYAVTDRDDHGLGQVPVVPLLNRGRLANWCGKSELTNLLPLIRAANKVSTDMMVAAEFVAIPLRGFLGVGPDAFVDESGNQVSAMRAILGRLLAVPDDGEGGTVRQFEFAAAQLSNFTEVMRLLAELVASIGALPPHYVGMATDNPASADAIRSSESRLVKRAERRQRAFGGAYEKAMRLVRRLQTGEWDDSLRQLETRWRNAATPTVAQSADASLKLYNLPVPIVPLRQTREDLGYSDVQIARMEQEDALAQAQQAEMFKMPTATPQQLQQDQVGDNSNPNAG